MLVIIHLKNKLYIEILDYKRSMFHHDLIYQYYLNKCKEIDRSSIIYDLIFVS